MAVPFPAGNRTYKAARTSGLRTKSAIELCVVHSAEATNAQSVANYFASGSATGSTHGIVDGSSCYITLEDRYVCWGAKGANANGWHLEFCGYAKWTRAEWLLHRRMLDNGAWRLALRCKWYGIPIRFLTVEQLRAGRRGLTTHYDVNTAFHGGTHWDPGHGFPRDVLLKQIRTYTKEYLT